MKIIAMIIVCLLILGLSLKGEKSMQLVLELQGPPTWRYAIQNDSSYVITTLTLDHKASGAQYSGERPDGWDIVQADSENIGWAIRDVAFAVQPGSYLSGFSVTFYNGDVQNSQEAGWALIGFMEGQELVSVTGMILVPSL